MPPIHGEKIGATKIVLKAIVGVQADCADRIKVDRPEDGAFGHVGKTRSHRQRQARFCDIIGTMLARSSNASVLVLSANSRRQSPGHTSL